MQIETWTICKNCGAEYGLHHYQTDQCPVGGREAPVGQNQEWKTTTFEPELDDSILEQKIAEYLKKNLRIFVERAGYNENSLKVSVFLGDELLDQDSDFIK